MLSDVSDDWPARDGDPIFKTMPSSRDRIFKKRNGKLTAAFAHMVNGAEEVGYDETTTTDTTTRHSGVVVILTLAKIKMWVYKYV